MSSTAAASRAPRILTGRMVLLYFVAFFGVIFAMNFYMVRVALSSFSGVETDSAYKAGLSFKKDIAASREQEALHWKVEANLQRMGDTTRVIVTAQDAEARPLTGLNAEVVLAHPTDKRRDVAVSFVEVSPGRFQSLTPLPQGRWDLVIGLRRADEIVFRSKSRISL